MANNQFSKKIILLNKEMICSSAMSLSNEILRKIVTLNAISF